MFWGNWLGGSQVGLSPTWENTLNSHLKSTPPPPPYWWIGHLNLLHREDDSGPRCHRFQHAFQPRPRSPPAARKHVPERGAGGHRAGADERRALTGFKALQSHVCELGLQLQQPRTQVRLRAEGQEAPERIHHLDQRGAQEAGAAQPRPGEHGPEQNPW